MLLSTQRQRTKSRVRSSNLPRLQSARFPGCSQSLVRHRFLVSPMPQTSRIEKKFSIAFHLKLSTNHRAVSKQRRYNETRIALAKTLCRPQISLVVTYQRKVAYELPCAVLVAFWCWYMSLPIPGMQVCQICFDLTGVLSNYLSLLHVLQGMYD